METTSVKNHHFDCKLYIFIIILMVLFLADEAAEGVDSFELLPSF